MLSETTGPSAPLQFRLRVLRTTPPWEGPDEIDRSGRSNDAARRGSAPHGPESDSKADDADPWATSAPSPETPRAARSEPATGNQADAPASDADDDDPWS